MPMKKERVSSEGLDQKEEVEKLPSASTSGTFVITSTYEQTAEATHKLGNLMAVAGSLTDMLVEGVVEPEETPGIYKKLQEVLREASHLSKQLLSSGRPKPPTPLTIDLNQEVARLMNIVSRIVKEKIVVSTRLASDLGKIKIDPRLLEQVMLNLVINARDAMPDGGKLTFETRNEQVGLESYIAFIVSDTGIGMDASVQVKIFEPFFTTKEAGKGTGVGLSTVLKIVQEAGGSIEVQSAKNAGATFIVRLPRVKE